MTDTRQKLDACYALLTQYFLEKGFKKKGLLFQKQVDKYHLAFQIVKLGGSTRGAFNLNNGISVSDLLDSEFDGTSPVRSHLRFNTGMDGSKPPQAIDVNGKTASECIEKTKKLIQFVDTQILPKMEACLNLEFMKAHFPEHPLFENTILLDRTAERMKAWLEKQ